MSDQDRIKLAEAMGWTRIWEHAPGKYMGANPDESGDSINYILPDPENDANDDYAVLEWMRKEFTSDQIGLALLRLGDNGGGPVSLSKYYQIGNYARAALKVLS